MYFSRIRIRQEAINSRNVASTIQSNIYNEHRMVWKFFPEDGNSPRDFLYRRFDFGRIPQYYFLSQRKPIHDLGIWEIETKEYDPVLREGDRFSFNLRVNPVVTKMPEGRESKKRKRDDVFMEALAKYKQLPKHERPTNNEIMVESGLDWFLKRMEKNGFMVNNDHVLVEGYHRFDGIKDQENHKIQLGVLDFSGVLEIADVDLFREKLFHGIGKAKAFGCGLLLIKRI